MVTMSIRIDEEEKKQAAKIAEYYGFDLSSVTRAFYKQMIREKRIPLNLGNYEPNEETIESLRESEEMAKAGVSRFKTVEETIASLKE